MTRTMLSRALVLATVVGAVAVLVAWGVRGVAGLAGAAAGLAMLLAFLLVGQLPVATAARGRRGLGAALLLGLYSLRLVLLVVAYRVTVANQDALDREALGLTVIAAALGWTVGTVWSALRWRPLLVEPEPSDPAQPSPLQEGR